MEFVMWMCSIVNLNYKIYKNSSITYYKLWTFLMLLGKLGAKKTISGYIIIILKYYLCKIFVYTKAMLAVYRTKSNLRHKYTDCNDSV